MQTLFAKGTVSGQELLSELVAIRTLMRGQRSAAAVGELMGSLEQAGTSAAGGKPFVMTDVLLTQNVRAMESVLGRGHA